MDPENPYAAYTERDLLDFLSSFQLEHEVGSHLEYSNLGFGMLGFALSKPLGSGYEGLLRSRILEPLQLGETSVTVPPEKAS